jgi:Tfp pilus assembly PilM family ATPase
MMISRERRPRVACEFTSTHIVAARVAARGLIDTAAVCPVQPGALTPALTGTNILERDVVRAATQNALANLGRDREVAAILPDACCRVVLIDFDVLPEKQEEADNLVRLRLKRSLPFDVDKACVSWQAQRVQGKIKVLAAAIFSSVLEEYESILREAGCTPGLVLPSTLASLRQIEPTAPALLIKVDSGTVSTAIVSDRAVVLVRVLDRSPVTQGREPGDGSQIAEAVHPALEYFQDFHESQVQRILISGTAPLEELNSSLEEIGITAHPLVALERLADSYRSQAGTLGAVAGALL